jgi:tetratricopeptide (TPR) repeat protein
MIRRASLTLSLFAALALPASAEAACPPTPDTSAERAKLMAELKAAPDEATGRAVEDAIWWVWIKAPDKKAQDLLDRGMKRRDAYDFEAAEKLFDELIAYCPHYPEGYNQRAFIRFLRENYDAALEDLDKTLEMRPDHFAALSGKGLVFFRQGRTGLSQKALREAVRLHPWLKERHMVVKEPGEDL